MTDAPAYSYPVVRLRPKAEARAIRHGFPWVYADELVPAPGGVAGALGLSSSPPPQATSRAQLNVISPCSILMAISL